MPALPELMLLMSVPAQAQDGAALLEENCGGCHAADAGGALSRIKGQRKTPEGWLMTIVRMRLFHGADIEPQLQGQLVHYLADTQGLAPAEAEDFRYILERQPAVIESPEAPIGRNVRSLPFRRSRRPATPHPGRMGPSYRFPRRSVADAGISGAGTRPAMAEARPRRSRAVPGREIPLRNGRLVGLAEGRQAGCDRFLGICNPAACQGRGLWHA